MPTDLPARYIDERLALRIFELTAGETGERFFDALVEHLARALDVRGAWVTEYLPERRRLKAYAFWLDGKLLENVEYNIAGTACEMVINERRLISIADGLFKRPGQEADASAVDPIERQLHAQGVVSYLGVPLLGGGGGVLGHLGVVDTRPMPDDEQLVAVFQLFASRALAELRRLRLERELRERENKLARLVSGAMDAIIELDEELGITLMNAAAEKVFGCAADRIKGESFTRFLTPEAHRKLTLLVRTLAQTGAGEPSLWIAGGLTAQRQDGSTFPAEATLSRRQAAHHGQLRGGAGGADRERVLRSRAWRLHRRDDPASGALRTGGRRHHLPGRSRRPAARPPGQAAAGPAAGRVRAGRQLADAQGGCARSGRDESRSRARDA